MSVKFNVIENKIICEDPNLVVYDAASWEPQLVNRLKGLMAISCDLDYAEEYLNRMNFDKETSLIDDALITNTIQLLVKCFTDSKGSRTRLDPDKVYRKYAQEIGEIDLTKTYESFVNARNTVITHDQDGYKEGIVSFAVDQESGVATDVIAITKKTTYLYKLNQETGLKLVQIAKSFTEAQINEIKTKLIMKYNDEKPELKEPILPEGLSVGDTWYLPDTSQ